MVGQREPAPDRIGPSVIGRTLTRRQVKGRPLLSLEVAFDKPLAPELAEALSREALELEGYRSSGVLVPRQLQSRPDGRGVDVLLDPFDPGALRLDSVLSALEAAGSPFGSPVSALVVGAVASRLRILHTAGRADGDLALSQILIGPGGGVALVCPGLRCVRAVLTPLEPRLVRLRRSAPEVLLGEPPTKRSDVYSLGALYYELLSWSPYRADAGMAGLRAAARAQLSPELPGALPDPRPSLVRLLESCLSPDPKARPADATALVSALRSELSKSHVALADRATLARLIEEYVPPHALRGPDALLAEPAPGLSSPKPPPPRQTDSSGWAAILGDEVAPVPEEAFDPSDERTTVSEREPNEASSASFGGSAPADVVGHSKPRIPAPSAPTSEIPSSALLMPVGQPLGALERPPPPRPVPTLDDAARLSPKTVISIALGVLVVVGGLVLTRALLDDDGDAPRTKADEAPAEIRRLPPPPPPKRTAATPPPRPPAPPPAARPIGLVSVMSKPSGANVLIDGGYVGRTPLVLKHNLNNRRRYEVEIVAEGYEGYRDTVRPKNGSISLVVELVPARK